MSIDEFVESIAIEDFSSVDLDVTSSDAFDDDLDDVSISGIETEIINLLSPETEIVDLLDIEDLEDQKTEEDDDDDDEDEEEVNKRSKKVAVEAVEGQMPVAVLVGATKESLGGMPTPPLSPDSSGFFMTETDMTLTNNGCDNFASLPTFESPVDVDAASEYGVLRTWEQYEPGSPNYKEAVLHDCMWNGLCKESGCRRRYSPTLATRKVATAHRRLRIDSGSSIYNVSTEQQPLSPFIFGSFGGSLPEPSPETHQPVAAYPLSDHSYHANRAASNPASPVAHPVASDSQWERNLGLETPSDSEEEIDVVSLPIKCQVQNPTAKTKVVNVVNSPKDIDYKEKLQMAVMVAAQTSRKRGRKKGSKLKLTLKRISEGSENFYQARRESFVRKMKLHDRLNRTNKQSGGSLTRSYGSRLTSLSCSGSERGVEKQKRREHNDMERKRRNDLKSSFQKLRMEVPILAALDRAPKVLILEKSKEWIYLERNKERRLLDTKEILRQRNDELKHRFRMAQIQFAATP